ncbi:uncharacterized protein LOC121772783 [Salvia splendens]|uniref:uncharacterized protein LOC121772783 n=1 Tax=Salvia splendens TaxID=180675 RepID=UPI001C2658EE|nr:uncharacterized protein LOC121772783 [Salvia splendens]XP_042025934.1 uncharacterized protein LOC121772783 [Salvia splendens]
MAGMEEMEAIKKAYAEMILNTAKEAAARVMAAELRARRTEQEMMSVKEEAANMLLRLKQMIDTKTKEAEITSLKQKNRFEELECQLNEAEGIILDLREELNQGQDQLDKLKKKKVVLKRGSQENAEEYSLTTRVRSEGYELLASTLNPEPEFISTIGKNNLLSGWSALAQGTRGSAKQNVIACLDQIMESDQFGNGGSERTCANEKNLVEETFPDVEKLNQNENGTNVESVNAVERTSVLDENIRYRNSEAASIVRRSVRKRKLKFWDDVIAACGLQVKKPRSGSAEFSCLGTRKMKKCAKSSEDLPDGDAKIESLDVSEVSKEIINNEAPENTELVDVLVKQDDLAATSELSSASRIECDVEDGAAEKASNLSYGDGNKPCIYTFDRRWRKKSTIHPEKVLDGSSLS